MADVAVAYGNEVVVRDIALTFPRESVTALAGPSGCGKTTLLRAVIGLLQPSHGTIARTLPAGSGQIGYAPQFPILIPWKSVRANVGFGLSLVGKEADSDLVDRLLEVAGLQAHENKYPGELSGGMCQRLSVIRALAMRPSLLVLDEPFSGSDWDQQLRLELEISRSCREFGAATIVVSHNIDRLVRLADRVIVLAGSPATVVENIAIPGSRDDRLLAGPESLDDHAKSALERIWSRLKEAVHV